MNRRQFLQATVAGAAASVFLPPVLSIAAPAPRSLSFFHTHTHEKLSIRYGNFSGYDKGALAEVNDFLKDFRTGEVHPIDPTLLDQLATINYCMGNQRTFDVISGYRSSKTNAQLRGRSKKVAKRSLHMRGQAIDVRQRGTSTRELRLCAMELQKGGVGYYPESDFVHLDTGRVRFW